MSTCAGNSMVTATLRERECLRQIGLMCLLLLLSFVWLRALVSTWKYGVV
jgi:hypothetical protein